MPFPAESLELARLRALGQLPPDNVDFEGPSDYVSPAEQSKLLPRGLATPAHAGGLQDVAAASRLQDSVNNTPPPPAAPQPSAEPASNKGPEGAAAIAASGPGPQVNWTSSDPAALADAVRDQKNAAAEASLAHTTGQLIRLAATAAAGGAAAGAAGAGAGAAGTGAGAASGAGFGSNYWSGLEQGSGTGAGGFLGRLSSGLLTGKTTGVEQDPTARLLATLYGMA